jgi:hypothetical protein
MEFPLQDVVHMLRHTGLTDVADEAKQTLPDPVDSTTLDQFCTAHGLSTDALVDRMGGSP